MFSAFLALFTTKQNLNFVQATTLVSYSLPQRIWFSSLLSTRKCFLNFCLKKAFHRCGWVRFTGVIYTYARLHGNHSSQRTKFFELMVAPSKHYFQSFTIKICELVYWWCILKSGFLWGCWKQRTPEATAAGKKTATVVCAAGYSSQSKTTTTTTTTKL